MLKRGERSVPARNVVAGLTCRRRVAGVFLLLESSPIISNNDDFVEECRRSCFRPVLDREVGRGSPQGS